MMRKSLVVSLLVCADAAFAQGIVAQSADDLDVGVDAQEVQAVSQFLQARRPAVQPPAPKKAKASTTYASAASPTQPTEPVRCTWEAVGVKHGVSPYLLYAIAKTESNLNPRAVGKNTNGTEDIGMMQINSSWLPTLKRWGVTRESLFDPCISLDVAGWILAANMRQLGVTWDAVGAYNAKSPAKRLKYATAVYRNLPAVPQ